MKNSRGRDSRKRDFGGRGSGARSQMYEAICAECGQVCEVPFRPTGDKPVYCTACFAKRQGSQSRRSGGRDFGKGRYRDRDRKMYSVICDKCGKPCQVPFQPTPGKPVYCDQCFGKSGAGPAQKSDQLANINAKLDKIINALIAAKIIKPEKEVKEVKKSKPTKKVAAKKTVAKKKAAAKKKK